MIDRRYNKPKRWREITIIGQARYEAKYKPREWVTIFSKHGIALQVNPTYMEFRVWVFTDRGDFSFDLNDTWIEHLQKIIHITNSFKWAVEHKRTPEYPKRQVEKRVKVYLSKGEKARITRAFNKIMGNKK